MRTLGRRGVWGVAAVMLVVAVAGAGAPPAGAAPPDFVLLPAWPRTPGALALDRHGELRLALGGGRAALARRLRGATIDFSCERLPAGRERNPVFVHAERTLRPGRPLASGLYPRRIRADFCAVGVAGGRGPAQLGGALALVGISPQGRLVADAGLPAITSLLLLSWALYGFTGANVSFINQPGIDLPGPPPLPAAVAGHFSGVLPLSSPSAPAPRYGRVGYWSDGAASAAVVVRTAAGRRLYIRLANGALTTNTGWLRDVAPGALPPLVSAAQPSAAGFQVTGADAHGITLALDAAAQAATAGDDLRASCVAISAGLRFTLPLRSGPVVTLPFDGAEPTDLAVPVDYCWISVSPPSPPGPAIQLTVGQPVATVAATPAGVEALDAQAAEQRLCDLLEVAEALAPTPGGIPHVAPVDAVVRYGAGAVVPLTGPGVPPPPVGELGYWSDGDRRAYLAIQTSAGQPLFVDLDGARLTTNADSALPLTAYSWGGAAGIIVRRPSS